MWILLTTKLPTDPSPPRLSIFWSTAWLPDSTVAMRAVEEWNRLGGQAGDEWVCEPAIIQATRSRHLRRGLTPLRTPNWSEARRIHYNDQAIRVFPHEFSSLDTVRMHEYIFGGSHELVAGDVATDALIQGVLDGITRPIMESALLDGCNAAQAMSVALGMDVTLPDAEFPPVGWYKCRIEYATMFCEPWEMEE